ETLDGEVKSRRLVASEFPVVQVRLVHDLGDDLDPPILDAEPLDERLERAVFAVMPKLRTEHIEWDALAGRIGSVGKRECRVGIVEAPDEPGGGDPIDMRPWARHPRAPGRRQRRSVTTGGSLRARLHGAQALGRRL